MYSCYLALVLLSALSLPGVFAATNDTHTVPIRTHSLYAPYVDQDLQNRWFDFGADAIVNTNKHIRLTQDRPHQMGWLWSRLPLSSDNFELEIAFSVDGQHAHLFGDGMAFWLTSTRAQPGPVFGSIDKFEGLGIMIDTFPNAKHPYSFPRIVGMLGDGKTAYDSINDGASNEAGACSAAVRGAEVTTKMRITYVKNDYLKVALHYKTWDEWTPCFTIPNVALPPRPYLGFSALTGDVSDAHDIVSIQANSFVVQTPYNASRRHATSKQKAKKGWGSLLFKMTLFCLACLGAFIGYRMYKEKVASKRF
ncbi:hypothetical protein CALCODRAFT_491563 [Calocera cornea HHB12733]|uniref:L-type lectin-like domain-containing protein n=1 Tax=Calocera cornea HHB12733 TaxID=1353952 RepID=A0A165IZ99_9BASI|nr:hypothetical protein CALCODRAFT_491563 [Calocera cornea HHB12733]